MSPRHVRKDGTEVDTTAPAVAQHAQHDGLVHGTMKQRLDNRRQKAEEISYEMTPKVTQETADAARTIVAGQAHDVADAKLMLDMLGLLPLPDASAAPEV